MLERESLLHFKEGTFLSLYYEAYFHSRMMRLPRIHDDVMLNGVCRICLWLVARKLRIPNRQKDL